MRPKKQGGWRQVWGLATPALLSALFYVAGPAIIDLMTTAPEVRDTARVYLIWAVATPVIATIAFQMDGIFISATWSCRGRFQHSEVAAPRTPAHNFARRWSLRGDRLIPIEP